MRNRNLKDKYIDATVVMGTYNGELFLKKQIESILSQTLIPKEILVVDDGSTDDTRKILKEYAKNTDVEFRLIFRKKNIGYIKNFIDGINRSRYDLIFLSDQDDEWLPKKVEYTVGFFDRVPDCVVLHSNTDIIDSQGCIISKNAQKYIKSKKISMTTLLKKVNYPGMALALRKSAIISKLNQWCLDNIELPTHDWTICFLGVINNGFYITDEVLTLRRFTGNNVALKLERPLLLSGTENRINGIVLYEKYYNLVNDVQNKYNTYYINIQVYLQNAKLRKTYLGNYSFHLWQKNFRNILYYPSIKSYFTDGILISKWKK